MRLFQLHETDIALPTVRQQKDYRCGSAIVRCIAKYAGVDKGLDDTEFDKLCKTTPTDGTSINNIIAALKTLKINHDAHPNLSLAKLFSFIDRGYPVICLIQARGINNSYDSGHYVAAVGYDSQYVRFEDPTLIGKRGRRTHKSFDKQWHDGTGTKTYDHYGIVIKVKTPKHMQTLDTYVTVK